MSRLVPISEYDNDANGDVVIIHGLNGHWRESWTAISNPEAFWPAWLAQHCPRTMIWCLDQDWPIFGKKSNISLHNRSILTIEVLLEKSIGRRPLVLIGSDVGGLLAKNVIKLASEDTNRSTKNLFISCRGVIFLDTPHRGANVLRRLGMMIRIFGMGRALQEFVPDAQGLLSLDEWYRNNAHPGRIETLAFRSMLPTMGIQIVGDSSADPGIPGAAVIPVDVNHLNIGKPTSREDGVYLRTFRFIDSILSCVDDLSANAPKPLKGKEMPYPVRLFISHAHKDVDIAEQLVDALQVAMDVPNGAIRCTSVPGYKLDLGAMAPDVLRQELASAECIVAVITPFSLSSQWVLFELGATWSQAKKVVPLLGGGLSDQDIPGPLRGAAGGALNDSRSLDQFLDQVMKTLGWAEKNSLSARSKLTQLAAYADSRSFFDEDIERERKASFSAKMAQIGETQARIVTYIINNLGSRSYIPQTELENKFGVAKADLYYRLEHLRQLEFVSKQEIGKKGKLAVFGWCLSKRYREEIT